MASLTKVPSHLGKPLQPGRVGPVSGTLCLAVCSYAQSIASDPKNSLTEFFRSLCLPPNQTQRTGLWGCCAYHGDNSLVELSQSVHLTFRGNNRCGGRDAPPCAPMSLPAVFAGRFFIHLSVSNLISTAVLERIDVLSAVVSWSSNAHLLSFPLHCSGQWMDRSSLERKTVSGGQRQSHGR